MLLCIYPSFFSFGFKMKVLVPQLCLTLCDHLDCNLPGSSAHGILQARILRRVAISSSRHLPNLGIEPALQRCKPMHSCQKLCFKFWMSIFSRTHCLWNHAFLPGSRGLQLSGSRGVTRSNTWCFHPFWTQTTILVFTCSTVFNE